MDFNFLSLFILKINSNCLENKNMFIPTFYLYLVICNFFKHSENLDWLVPITLNRLVFAQSGFLIFICIEMLNRLKK